MSGIPISLLQLSCDHFVYPDSLHGYDDPLRDSEMSIMPAPPSSPIMASPTARTAKVVVASSKKGLTVLKREVHVVDEIFPNVPSPSKKARMAPGTGVNLIKRSTLV